jgi:tetratricopeptide (TPR) repeat protein
LSLLFWIFFAKGSSYGGIRHALSAIPLLALIGALAIYKAAESKSYLLRGAIVVGLFAALISAIPVMRPWEYFNETVGGTANAHRYFNDEGVDLGLRSKELADYYNQNIKPTGEIPYVAYFGSYNELKKRGLDYLGKDRERDREKLNSESITGTIILGATEFSPKLWWDKKTFREATPIARFGNVFVFRGTFKLSELRVSSLYWGAISRIYTDKPETELAISMLSKSVEIEPRAFFAALELGNQYLKIGNREEALRAYRIAKENVLPSDETSELLSRQIERVETEPLEQIQPVRNPGIE